MAIQKSGISLVAENYSSYIRKMSNVNKAHREAFDTKPIDNYRKMASKVASDSKNLSRASNDLWKTVSKLRGSFDSAGASIRSMSSLMDRAKSSSSGLNSTMIGGVNTGRGIQNVFEKAKDTFSNFTSSLSAGAAGIKSVGASVLSMIPAFIKWLGVLTALMKAWQFFKQSGDIAQRNETLAVTLNEMGKQAGYSAEQIAFAEEQLKQQGITTAAARQALVRMTRANLSWAEASKLAAIAQGSAVAAGMNSSEAFERLVLGIQKMEPELLDELGITLRRSDAYKELASTLGVSERALTEQQKQQAILNEIYRQSEPVLGVYGAAMETSGKKQGSLTRHIEEAQASLGKLWLPIKGLSVDMKTGFWKAIRDVAKGLEAWVPIVQAAVDALKALMSAVGNFTVTTEGAGETIGKFLHWLARDFVVWAAKISAVMTTVGRLVKDTTDTMAERITATSAAMISMSRGRFAQALDIMRKQSEREGMNAGQVFVEEWFKSITAAQRAFPDLFKTWEEFTKTPDEIDLNLPKEQEEVTEDLEDQKDALNEQLQIYYKLDDIVRSYRENVANITGAHDENMRKMDEQARKAEQALAARVSEQLNKLEADAIKKRQKLIDDFQRNRVREEKKMYRELEQARERFLLSQAQAMRRFKVQDRRLRAEGDVLGLMDLREDFELQQKEATENFELSQKQAKEDQVAQQEERQQDLDRRMQELEEGIAERRQEIQNAYQDELQTLRTSNEEKRNEAIRAYQEQLDLAKRGMDEQIENLGRSLADQGKLTEEGMQEIYNQMQEVFGESRQADALMKGYKSRSESIFGGLIDNLKKKLNDLEKGFQDSVNNIQQIANNIDLPSPASGNLTGGGPGNFGIGMPTGMPRPLRQMRQGGVGVVTGPATFAVEPGQREAVMFAPLPTRGPSSSLNVNMQGGFDIRGAESIGRAATEAAVERMVNEFGVAIRKLTRR